MNSASVVIVTHNSQDEIGACLTSLDEQTVQPETTVIVDSGSIDSGYLQPYRNKDRTVLHLEKNIGFGRANNLGFKSIDRFSDFVLFLNPDAFPEPNTIELAINYLVRNKDVGCVSGRLLGFDSKLQQATGFIDSTGVFRKWYGRWHDRGQGEPDDDRFGEQEDIPAACAAFLFCRKEMLDQVALSESVIFDPDFFLYKEDIELCLRIQKSPWRIVYLPDLKVFHCRGWQSRHQVPYQQRLTAAASELLLYWKHPSPYMLWALIKYVLVRWLRV